MSPQEYIDAAKNKFGTQTTKDGQLVRDMNDFELMDRLLKKYPGDREKIETTQLDEYYNTYDPSKKPPPPPPKTGVQKKIDQLTGGLTEAFKRRTQAQEQALGKTIDGEQGIASGFLQAAGQGAGFLGDVGFEGLKFAGNLVEADGETLTEKIGRRGEEIVGSEAGQAVLGSDAVQGAVGAYEGLPEEVRGNIEAVGNIASVIPAIGASGKAAQVGIKAAKEGAEAAVEGTKNAISRVSRVTGEALDERRISNIDKAKKDIDSTVGQIVQGKPKDIEKAKRALSNIDTEGVKTYKDLNERIGDNVEALSEKLDEFLDEQPGTLKSDDVAIETKVGDTVVRQNFVDDALEQLSELYTTIKDAPAAARIENIRTQFNAGGLTRKEINNIAKEYGREFGSKAFGKTGEALTSVNAQAYENTRKGIKSAFRNTVEGDLPKQIDSQISDLIQTGQLTKKMEERVNALYQKVKNRGLAEKIARKLGDVVNLATLNTVQGFIGKFIPSNVGLKTLNSIDLENALSKNLKKIESLLEKTDDTEVVDGLVEIIKSTD